MKIGLFGGSFNPIHKGHIKIAKAAIKELKLDQLIFIPCQRNPFKKDVNYVDSQKRLEMIEMVLEDKMIVSSFEINQQGTSYTIETVKHFRNKYPHDEIFLIIGSDNLTKLQKWKNIDQISKLSQIVIFKREKQINKTNIKKYQCLLINNQLFPESSTDFLKGNFDILDQKVLTYIGKYKLYFDDILKNCLDHKRYLHSLHAKNFAIELAKNNNFNIEKAAFAAFVHDIGKNIANNNKEKARKDLQLFYGTKKTFEDYELHQEIGYMILKKFQIEEDIAHAVKVHTSLSLELNTLDKIVYLADKLCQGRKYPNIQEHRKIALSNIDEGLKIVINKTIEFNLSKGLTFTKKQQEIYDKWIK